MPTGTASRSAPPPAPGRTPPEPLPPVRTKGQSRSARRAVCPGLFLLRRLPACPACRISSPARAGCCRRPPRGKAGKYPGSAGRGTRILRQPPAPGRTGTASAAPMTPQPTKLHSLHTLPDLTAASSPPPAPTDTAPRQPCRPPAAADHPATSQKPPTAAHRRRGQILYLTGIWPLQYSQ